MHYYIHNRHCYKELSCTPDYAAELSTVYTQVVFFHPVDLFPLNGGQDWGFPTALHGYLKDHHRRHRQTRDSS